MNSVMESWQGNFFKDEAANSTESDIVNNFIMLCLKITVLMLKCSYSLCKSEAALLLFHIHIFIFHILLASNNSSYIYMDTFYFNQN